MLNKALAIALAIVAPVAMLGMATVFAANNSTFTQVINPGILSVDIVDGLFAPVATPTVPMTALNSSISCQTSTGTLGTASEQIYIQNPDSADNGWTVSIAATSGSTATWTSAGTDYDFNDPTGTPAGCTDGADTDSFGGQMTLDASGATLANGNCTSCNTTGVSLGSSASFEEGVTDSITLVNAGVSSDDIADYTVQGVSVSQQVPGGQPAAADYQINMTLSIVAI